VIANPSNPRLSISLADYNLRDYEMRFLSRIKGERGKEDRPGPGAMEVVSDIKLIYRATPPLLGLGETINSTNRMPLMYSKSNKSIATSNPCCNFLVIKFWNCNIE
jgi:hypothetical protein